MRVSLHQSVSIFFVSTLLLAHETHAAPYPKPNPNVLQDFGDGLVGGVNGFIKSTSNAILRPVQTLEGIGHAVLGIPDGSTLTAIGGSMAECWEENKARCLGSATALVGTGLAGGAAFNVASKGLKASSAARAAAGASDDVARLTQQVLPKGSVSAARTSSASSQVTSAMPRANTRLGRAVAAAGDRASALGTSIWNSGRAVGNGVRRDVATFTGASRGTKAAAIGLAAGAHGIVADVGQRAKKVPDSFFL